MKAVVPHEEGYSCNNTAGRMKVARATVQHIVKQYKETGSVKDWDGRGRKKRQQEGRTEF